jgi:flagellar motor protein MotB
MIGAGGQYSGHDFAGQHFDIFKREQAPKGAGWVMFWSDLMMTMFIMFAALYIFAVPALQTKTVQTLPLELASSVSGVAAAASTPSSILERIYDRLRDRIEQAGLGATFFLRIVPEKAVHLVLAGDGLFEPGGSALRTEVRSSLLSLSDILRSAPQILAVVGHVAPGELPRGPGGPWELSVARAADVAGVLMREAGLPPGRMFVAGYGDQRPVSGEGADRSRRVELILCAELPTEPLPGAAAPVADGFRSWIAVSKEGGN